MAFIGNVSKESAVKLNHEFQTSIKKIEADPKSYPFFSGDYIPNNKYRKYVVSKRYIIIYQVIEDIISIDYVVDTRTDYSWLLKGH